MVEQKDQVLKAFNHTLCPDELFLQTVLWNSPFREKVYDLSDEYHSCMRKIDWKRGNPYTWQLDDFSELIANQAFFGRKFSSKDEELIQKLVNYLRDH